MFGCEFTIAPASPSNSRASRALSVRLLKLLCRQYAARVALLLVRDDHVRQRGPPAEAPRGVLSRGGHGGDPPQKFARHHNALVTEGERGGARNGVGKVVVPAGRRSALHSAELGDKARMVEQVRQNRKRGSQ